MSSRSRPSSGRRSDGEGLSGDEEKAISTHAPRERDSKVNTSARTTTALRPSSSSRPARHMYGDQTEDYYFHFRDSDGTVKLPHDARSRSPYRRDRSRSRSRSRSPYRAAKSASGEKRRREDDHYSTKSVSDPRRFKVHYEDRPSSRGGDGYRPHRSYADLDRPDGPKTHLQHDDRSFRPRDPSGRGRSRSPFRRGHVENNSVNGSTKVFSTKDQSQDETRGGRRDSTPSVSEHESIPHASNTRHDTKFKMSLLQPSQKSTELTPSLTQQTTDETERTEKQLTENEIIEQRRKRREAIKARHKSQGPLLVQALEQSMPSAPSTPLHDSSGLTSEQQSPPSFTHSPQTPNRDSPPASPAAFAVNDDEELANRHRADVDEDGPSAADYDPNMDVGEDRPDHKRSGIEPPMPNTAQPGQSEGEEAKPVKEFDMFADDDDDDDMFAPTDKESRAATPSLKQAKTLDQSLLDNWDYPDGHYRIMLGELLNGRYAVQQQVGKGTFATVVRAQDVQTGQAVAIKIAANNETMYKAGQKEMDFLTLLNQNDPDDKKHIIRLLRHFDHKGHMCIVFEALSADLREVLKKFGRNVGLNLKAIRSYAQQMFLALGHLKKCQILHADLKPDNMLVSERRNVLKICDLGTAAFAADAEVTPYLVSRFYRAPEVILGMPFDFAIDMWSVGCTLFELYTGRILFAGADNNQMLRAVQECRGKFPHRMLKRASLGARHFDADGNFFSQERDPVTGKTVVRPVAFHRTPAGMDLRSRLSGNAKGLAPAEMREHAAFVDLLDRCLQLDPARRISPHEALRHAFVAPHPQVGVEERGRKGVVSALGVPARVR